MQRPSIGEIWIVTIPVIYYDEEQNININLQKRPCLVIDDGRGLIVEDKRNFHVFKLTTQNDSYKRKEIKDWKKIGLKSKSYVRIEMPIKIEDGQFVNKICDLPLEQLKDMYKELYELINIEALEKFVNLEKTKQ